MLPASKKVEDFVFVEKSLADVEFNNLFAGGGRFASFKVDKDIFDIKLGRPVSGFSASVVFNLKIGDESADVLVENLSDLSEVDEKFAGIDLMLLDNSIRVPLLKILFFKHISEFGKVVGMSISIEGVKFGDSASENLFEREISVLVTKNSDKSVIFNLRLNDSLLRNMCSSFKKVKIDTGLNKESIFFDWYLQVGKTKLAFDSYKNLEQFDIIFLDDYSSFQSKRYAMKGLGNVVINGELNGSSFVVNGKCS